MCIRDSGYTVAADLQDLDEKIKSMIEVGEKLLSIGSRKRTSRICKVCNKEGDLKTIKDHIEANHITGVSHTCDICGATSRTRHAMDKHRRKYHK